MMRMSEAQLKSALAEVEMLLTAATDIDTGRDLKWRDKLASGWYQTGKMVKVSVMKELRTMNWKAVRDRQLMKKF